jgi:hypothetical protein
VEQAAAPVRLGGCLCGAVRYKVSGDVGRPMACHCHMCRRFHGALGVFIGASRGAIELSGSENIHWFASSANAERGSCRLCGSKLFWRDLTGEAMDVTVGCLDRSEDAAPTGHIWVDHRGDYEVIDDGLPMYAQSSRKAGVPVPPLEGLAPRQDDPALVAPPHAGGCLCGAVRFEIDATLQDVVICHCAQCRHWHGFAGAYTVAPAPSLTLQGEAELNWYPASPMLRRGFCRICSSCLFWQIMRDGQPADEISISAGALDGPTGITTAREIFLADQPGAYRFSDSVIRAATTWSSAHPSF